MVSSLNKKNSEFRISHWYHYLIFINEGNNEQASSQRKLPFHIRNDYNHHIYTRKANNVQLGTLIIAKERRRL